MMKKNRMAFGASRILKVGFLVFWLTSCGSNTEKIQVPTTGLITTVKEVQKGQFKIVDEQTIADTAKSLIIAQWIDGQVDTLTLSQARLLQNSNTHGTHGGGHSFLGVAMSGYFGYMMGRSMSTPVQSSAYVNSQTYDRVNQSTGSQVRSSSVTTTRPTAGRSGFGSRSGSRSTGGGSTRSYGG